MTTLYKITELILLNGGKITDNDLYFIVLDEAKKWKEELNCYNEISAIVVSDETALEKLYITKYYFKNRKAAGSAGKVEIMMTLEMIMKNGKIENEEQAAVFAENADFYDSEEGNGDFRIDTENGYAEIYGHREKSGEDEEMPVADSEQDIRFYNKDMNQIENPFK